MDKEELIDIYNRHKDDLIELRSWPGCENTIKLEDFLNLVVIKINGEID